MTDNEKAEAVVKAWTERWFQHKRGFHEPGYIIWVAAEGRVYYECAANGNRLWINWMTLKDCLQNVESGAWYEI